MLSLKEIYCRYLAGFAVVLIKMIYAYVSGIHACNTSDCAKKETKSFLSKCASGYINFNYVNS